MARITLNDLAPDVRARVMAQYGITGSRAKNGNGGQATASRSPYADRLGEELDRQFPGRMAREYRPIPGRRFRIDFAFPAEKVAIEFDGYRHHGFSHAGFHGGAARQNILVGHHWWILRYTLKDVRDHLDDVVTQVRTLLEQTKGETLW
ncbi:MAG: DUF559 domain-containing protein [Planctomycetia bacterium]|nr:DUF559 domain-containing protein [Planctomycetia bacterium]